MALVKLPDGQIVNKDLVESVQSYESQLGHYVDVHVKGSQTVSILCDSEAERKEMLAKVSQALGL